MSGDGNGAAPRAGARELEDAIWPASRPTPRRRIACRSCGAANRVAVPTAVTSPERVRCGSCGEALFIDRDAPLERMASVAYQHALDRRALAALESIPGVPALMRGVLERIGDRAAWMQFMSDAVLCSPEQFPELIALMERARARLDVPHRPTVFLGESPHMNALTTGVRRPVIVVRSALLDQMNDDELVAILGHELGHLHADHPLYQSVANALVQGGSAASRTVRVLATPIRRALLRWSRYAELTADRAALLASRDIGACIGTMVTFAGGNRPGTSKRTRIRLGPFIEQCRELSRLEIAGGIDQAVGNLLVMDRTHPHVAWRVMHLIQWVEHGNYLDILSGRYPRRAPAAAERPHGRPAAAR